MSFPGFPRPLGRGKKQPQGFNPNQIWHISESGFILFGLQRAEILKKDIRHAVLDFYLNLSVWDTERTFRKGDCPINENHIAGEDLPLASVEVKNSSMGNESS